MTSRHALTHKMKVLLMDARLDKALSLSLITTRSFKKKQKQKRRRKLLKMVRQTQKLMMEMVKL